MTSALVKITDTVTLVTATTGVDLAVTGRPYMLANTDDSGVAAWRWALRTKPVGSAATLGSVITPSVMFVPDVAGTYMFLLQVYSDVEATELVGAATAAIAVRETSGVRIPGVGETSEIDPNNGWAADVNATLKYLLANMTGGTVSLHKINDLSGDTYIDTEFTSNSNTLQTAAGGTIIGLQTQTLSKLSAAPAAGGQQGFVEYGQQAPALAVLGGTAQDGAALGAVGPSTLRTQWGAAHLVVGGVDQYKLEGRIHDESASPNIDQRISALRNGTTLTGLHNATYASGGAGFSYTLTATGTADVSIGADNAANSATLLAHAASSGASAGGSLSFGTALGSFTLSSTDGTTSSFGIDANVLTLAKFPETRNDGPRYAALDAGGAGGTVSRGPVVLGERYTQTAHGFSVTLGAVPIPVYYLPGTGWTQATNAASASVAQGVIVQTPDANTLIIVSSGYADLTPGHGLSDGYFYFLSNAAPYYTTVQPTYGNIVQALWRVEGNRLFVLGQPARIEAPPVNTAITWKAPVRVLAASNVTVASPGAAIDGVTMAVDDRVFLGGQTAAAENGIYVYNGAAVPMTRATDADTSAEVVSGAAAFVSEGTHAGTVWGVTTANPITLGTTALTISALGGGSTMPPIRYAGALGKAVTQAGSEQPLGAFGAVDPTLFLSPTFTFDATFTFSPGASGSVEIRLYDMGTRASPTAGTLRSTISTTYTSAGVQQAISRTLTTSATPGTNTDQIYSGERVYEIRAILIGTSTGDALLVENASLTIVSNGGASTGTVVNWSNVSAALAAATSTVNVNGQKVVNAATPTAATDLSTKGYVDNNRAIASIQHVVAGSEGTAGSPIAISAGVNAVECESTAADTYLILPSLVDAPIGTVIQVSKANTSTHLLNVKPDSGSSINSGTTDASVVVPNSSIASSTSTGASAVPDVAAQFMRTGVSTWRMR